MALKNFTKLILGLLRSAKNEDKTELILNYLSIARSEDKLWMLYFLSGGKFKKSISSEILKKCALIHTGLPLWLFEECLKMTGDLTETISLVLREPEKKSNYSLAYWLQFIDTIRSLMPMDQADKILTAWSMLLPEDIYIFNKLAAGTFKIKLNVNLAVSSLAEYTGLSKSIISKKLAEKWYPDTISYAEFISTPDSYSDISKPYYFFSAAPLVNIPQDHNKWTVEWKWDGVRAQFIKREGELFIWTKDEELITHKFPEFDLLKNTLPDGVVLDGEILCMKNNRPMPFHALKLRLGRKYCSQKQLKESPAVFIVFDILEWNGKDIRYFTFSERLKILSNIKEQIINNKIVQLSELNTYNSLNDLKELRKKARSSGASGLILKRKDSVYKKLSSGDWLAWKAEPYVINAVLSYVNFGQGNDEIDFTFGVWSGGELVSVAKVTPVLTEKEMISVYNFIKNNTLERFGPVRTVKPQLVFEIAFESIAHSSRHKSGVIIRNPWMGKWRKDIKAKEAYKIEELLKLINFQ